MKRCDRCGRFTTCLHDVPTNPPEGGIDHEACCRCIHPESEHPAGPYTPEETK